MKIISQKFNLLMAREEIIASVEAEKTPSRKDVISSLASALKTKEDLIIVNKISGSTGKRSFQINAFVYKKTEDMPSYETERMKARMSGGKAKSVAAPTASGQPEKKGE
jgi:ribosomal protein S24E